MSQKADYAKLAETTARLAEKMSTAITLRKDVVEVGSSDLIAKMMHDLISIDQVLHNLKDHAKDGRPYIP